MRRVPGQRPERVVALGGGTGLPSVLRGLRSLVARGEMSGLTAIVAMSDDGGSSGRLRRSRGLQPPGDVRNCLVALAEEEDLLAAIFQHRYEGDEELGGHKLGNLILAALAEQTGSFLKAVEMSSHVLRTVGDILPVTLDHVTLEATLAGGERLVGETAIGECGGKIERVELQPASARPTPGVVEAILEADLVVLGPGSLFTSVIPNIVLPEVNEALRRTGAVRVLVGNLASELGESAGLGIEDHVRHIERHAGAAVIDAVLAHEGPIDPATRERYRAEGAEPLVVPQGSVGSVAVFRHNLLGPGPKLRHDSVATAAGLLEAWSTLTRSVASGER